MRGAHIESELARADFGWGPGARLEDFGLSFSEPKIAVFESHISHFLKS